MSLFAQTYALQHVHNDRAVGSRDYGERQRRVLNHAAFEAARKEITSWPGYAPSPLVLLAGLATAAGVDAIWYKDESQRFGLGSFKALGGAYAVLRLLITEIEKRTGKRRITSRDLIAGTYREITRDITVTCATDGNHGRSVAWGARTFGCKCVIYIHATVSEARKLAIENFGATVVRTRGNYDDSVREAAEAAADARPLRRLRYLLRRLHGRAPRRHAGLCVDGRRGHAPASRRPASHPRVRPGRSRWPRRRRLRPSMGTLGRGSAPVRRRRAGQGGVPVRERPPGASDRRPWRPRYDHGRSRLRRGFAARLGDPGGGCRRFPHRPRRGRHRLHAVAGPRCGCRYTDGGGGVGGRRARRVADGAGQSRNGAGARPVGGQPRAVDR